MLVAGRERRAVFSKARFWLRRRVEVDCLLWRLRSWERRREEVGDEDEEKGEMKAGKEGMSEGRKEGKRKPTLMSITHRTLVPSFV